VKIGRLFNNKKGHFNNYFIRWKGEEEGGLGYAKGGCGHWGANNKKSPYQIFTSFYTFITRRLPTFKKYSCLSHCINKLKHSIIVKIVFKQTASPQNRFYCGVTASLPDIIMTLSAQ